MNQFRAGQFTALICTNLGARGIDVPEVDIVINYDIPTISDNGYFEPDYANYLHRVGRTGRFQTDGLAITFYTTEGNKGENEASYISKIERCYEMKMQEIVSIEEFMHLFYEMRPQLRRAAEGAFGEDLE
jgi:ATP-dependent RNA helicase DeaD